jgi:hypothetical protein
LVASGHDGGTQGPQLLDSSIDLGRALIEQLARLHGRRRIALAGGLDVGGA